MRLIMSRLSSKNVVLALFIGFGCAAAVAVPFSLAHARKSDKPKRERGSPLEGAWRLVSSKDPRSGAIRPLPPGIEMTKLVVGGRYAWTVSRDGKAIGGAGGEYQVDENTYTEAVRYSIGANSQLLVSKNFTFSWKIKDGHWHHMGTLAIDKLKQEIDEVWERCPEPSVTR